MGEIKKSIRETYTPEGIKDAYKMFDVPKSGEFWSTDLRELAKKLLREIELLAIIAAELSINKEGIKMRISQLSGNKLSNYVAKPLKTATETTAGKAVVGTAKFCVGNLMGAFYAAGGIVTGISPGLKLLEYCYKAIGCKDLAQKI